MLETFNRYIAENKLLRGRRPVLAAVSGGVDSVVLIRLLEQSGIPFAIAHCNFGLRGRESDGDEKFVKSLASKYGVKCFSIKFNTSEFAEDNRLGIQAAARKLRYDWFRQLIREHGFQSVATAHHADDLAETVLLHIIRGTGLSGYLGIRPLQKGLVRPLLFATRSMIMDFAEREKLKWRNDSSNDTDHYIRNKLRHHVMPLLTEINPSLSMTMLRNAEVMAGYEMLIRESLEQHKAGRLRKQVSGIIIDTKNWSRKGLGKVLLYEWLNEYGFNGDTCHRMDEGIRSHAVGNRYEGTGYAAVIERERLFVEKRSAKTPLPVLRIDTDRASVTTGFFRITCEKRPVGYGKRFASLPDFGDPLVLYADLQTLSFPLELRPWKQGDRFRPLGMKGSKLVSDLITDLRLTNQQKEHLYLLWSGDKVVWVVGYRADDRFKLTSNTREALKITLELT